MSLYELKENIKAFFRGEKRIAPSGSVGRVYADRKPGNHAAAAKMKGSLTKVRVFRKATGTWETVYAKDL